MDAWEYNKLEYVIVKFCDVSLTLKVLETTTGGARCRRAQHRVGSCIVGATIDPEN